MNKKNIKLFDCFESLIGWAIGAIYWISVFLVIGSLLVDRSLLNRSLERLGTIVPWYLLIETRKKLKK